MDKIGNFIGKYMVFIVLAILLVLMSIWTWNAIGSNSWPHVMGVITKSDIDTGSGSGGALSISPAVTYKYTVDGKEYTASRISYIPIQGRKPSVECIRKYPKGANVAVHYNPRKHERAVLEPGFRFRRIMGFMLFFFSLFVTIIVVAVLWRKRHAAKVGEAGQEVS